MATIRYPDSDRKHRTFGTPERAIEEAYRDADTEAVEVWEGETMLVRYEHRDEPLFDVEPPEPSGPELPGVEVQSRKASS